jgi:hypothetical protein
MSGVVLRCPNCGTTRVAPGECEACHEAQVRYYCTNHSPGLWLEMPACAQCGAVFGEKAKPRAPAPAARPRAPHTARPPAPSARPRPVYPPAARPEAEGSSTRSSRRVPPKRDDDVIPDGEHFGRTPSLQELLREALRARHMPPPAYERETPTPRAGPSLGGCLVRLMLLLFFLFLATMSGVFLFATSWL